LREKKGEQRIPIGAAMPVVDDILAKLKEIPGLRNLTPTGSLQRFQETAGDIDLIGTADLSAGFRDGDTLIDVDLGFSQLVNDLLWSEVFLCHLSPLFVSIY